MHHSSAAVTPGGAAAAVLESPIVALVPNGFFLFCISNSKNVINFITVLPLRSLGDLLHPPGRVEQHLGARSRGSLPVILYG